MTSIALRTVIALTLLMGLPPGTSHAADSTLGTLRPSTLFIQGGIGDQRTYAYVVGSTWNWHWSRQYSFLTATGLLEADIGRWTTDEHGVHSSAWVTQLGLTPVIRLQPAGLPHYWLLEVGIGANYIVPLYRTGHKRFSTAFNFGDHIGIGRLFGAHQQHELVLRLQHFSNAGIDHPNPGENFLQLRYAHQL